MFFMIMWKITSYSWSHYLVSTKPILWCLGWKSKEKYTKKISASHPRMLEWLMASHILGKRRKKTDNATTAIVLAILRRHASNSMGTRSGSVSISSKYCIWDTPRAEGNNSKISNIIQLEVIKYIKGQNPIEIAGCLRTVDYGGISSNNYCPSFFEKKIEVYELWIYEPHLIWVVT